MINGRKSFPKNPPCQGGLLSAGDTMEFSPFCGGSPGRGDPFWNLHKILFLTQTQVSFIALPTIVNHSSNMRV